MATGVDAETAQRLRMVFGHLARVLRPTEAGLAADLTPTRVAVLLNTVRNGPIRLADVAEQEGLNPTLLSRTVAKLAEDGLLIRTPDESDRRSAWLDATQAGRDLAAAIRAQRTQAVESALVQLSTEDRALVEAALPALEQLAQHMHQGV
ncbi:MAG TPA: MarR family transcriptional regulator [Solirubrobacteraceae bacterium]|jgi:DNA-binding MarR family transcriptional regulator|nr:MarR family transcriptional regulator [Solirubrobacteraceae bacterium]